MGEIGQRLVDGLPGSAHQLGNLLLGEVVRDPHGAALLGAEPLRELQQLLGGEVFDGFQRAIREREERGEKVESSLVGIDKADIIEAEVKNRTAYVTVKFVSELISVTRDAEGEVVEGDPKKVREVTDIWTFAREVASRNPN